MVCPAAAAGGATTVGATSAPRARGRAVRTAPTLETAREGCTSAPFLRREGTWVGGAVRTGRPHRSETGAGHESITVITL